MSSLLIYNQNFKWNIIWSEFNSFLILDESEKAKTYVQKYCPFMKNNNLVIRAAVITVCHHMTLSEE